MFHKSNYRNISSVTLRNSFIRSGYTILSIPIGLTIFKRYSGKKAMEAMNAALAESGATKSPKNSSSSAETSSISNQEAPVPPIQDMVKSPKETYDAEHYIKSDNNPNQVQKTPSGDPGFLSPKYAHLAPQTTESYKGIYYEDSDDDFKIAPQEEKSVPLYKNLVAVKLKPGTVDENQNPLPPHELDHHLVGERDPETGVIRLTHILSSAKNNFVTKQSNTLLDEYINFNLDGKPQRLAALKEPRVFDPSTEYETWEINAAVTKYINQTHIYTIIEAAIEAYKSIIPIIRRHKDDTIFLTEKGNNILDEEQ